MADQSNQSNQSTQGTFDPYAILGQDPYRAQEAALATQVAKGPYDTGHPWMDTFNKVVNNPLVQGALSGYFGLLTSPRWIGRGAQLGIAGEKALQAYGAAEQRQHQDPAQKLAALTALSKLQPERAQAAAALARSSALQKQYMISPEQTAVLQSWLDSPGVPDSLKPQIKGLMASAKAGNLTGDQLAIQIGNITKQFDPKTQQDIATSKARENLANQQATLIGPERERDLAAAEASRASAAKSGAEVGQVGSEGKWLYPLNGGPAEFHRFRPGETFDRTKYTDKEKTPGEDLITIRVRDKSGGPIIPLKVKSGYDITKDPKFGANFEVLPDTPSVLGDLAKDVGLGRPSPGGGPGTPKGPAIPSPGPSYVQKMDKASGKVGWWNPTTGDCKE